MIDDSKDEYVVTGMQICDFLVLFLAASRVTCLKFAVGERKKEGASRRRGTSDPKMEFVAPPKILSVCHKQSNPRRRDWRISICLARSGNICRYISWVSGAL